MFLLTKNKIATQIALVIMNTLRPTFLFTVYLKDGVLNPPFGFWTDKYILGFSYGLASLFIQRDFGGTKWSPQKKGEVIIKTFERLTPDWRASLTICNEESMNPVKGNNFSKGFDDAASLYAITNGILNRSEYEDNPIIKKSVELAKALHGSLSDIGASQQSEIAASFSSLTIQKYIEEIYLPEKYGAVASE